MKPTCPYCIKVMNFMSENNITIPLRDIVADESAAETLLTVGGRKASSPLSLHRWQAALRVQPTNHRVASQQRAPSATAHLKKGLSSFRWSGGQAAGVDKGTVPLSTLRVTILAVSSRLWPRWMANLGQLCRQRKQAAHDGFTHTGIPPRI